MSGVSVKDTADRLVRGTDHGAGEAPPREESGKPRGGFLAASAALT